MKFYRFPNFITPIKTLVPTREPHFKRTVWRRRVATVNFLIFFFFFYSIRPRPYMIRCKTNVLVFWRDRDQNDIVGRRTYDNYRSCDRDRVQAYNTIARLHVNITPVQRRCNVLLYALFWSDEILHSSIRLSFPRFFIFHIVYYFVFFLNLTNVWKKKNYS